MLAPKERLSWLFKSLLWCQKKMVPSMESKQTYYVLHIPYSVYQFWSQCWSSLHLPQLCLITATNHCAALVRNLPTSIFVRVSVSLLTFQTATILAPLWFMNFECCSACRSHVSIATLSCLADSSSMPWPKPSNNIEGS